MRVIFVNYQDFINPNFYHIFSLQDLLMNLLNSVQPAETADGKREKSFTTICY